MNVILLTLSNFRSFNEHSIYCELLREFRRQGHEIYCISPAERRTGEATHFEEDGHLLKLSIGNTQKTNVIEKGISTLMIEPQFIAAIKKYFADVKFDLVLYSTPPITLVSAVEFIKKRDGAQTYLLLKDIFPQNAVDLGMMSKSGVKGLLYRYFRNKEKTLYAVSDRIGCMSQANVDYVLRHNPEVAPAKVEVCPNCIELRDMAMTAQERAELREKYGIPQDKTVFVYGGNLGRPQGIPFILECLKTQMDNDRAYFLICGNGTEFSKLQAFFDREKPRNMKLLQRLPREDYERLTAACDVGMIFLDHRFTIPNFPSRLLAYMQANLPVLACTDPNTDVGKVITEGGFGWWCESKDAKAFAAEVEKVLAADLPRMGAAGKAYLKAHYTVETGYEIIAASMGLR